MVLFYLGWMHLGLGQACNKMRYFFGSMVFWLSWLVKEVRNWKEDCFLLSFMRQN